MMNEKQICAGHVQHITIMCRPAMLTMMKRGNEHIAIGSKVKGFPLQNFVEV
jgi:hypothetical protein